MGFSRRQTGVESRKQVADVLARYPAKVLGQITGAPADTTRRWRSGEAEPNTQNFLALARVIPEIRAYALDAMGMGDTEFKLAAEVTLAINAYLQSELHRGGQ